MKNKWHDIIRKRLAEYKGECLACLYPKPFDYSWGSSKKTVAKTIRLVNKIVKDIPIEAWPNEEYYEGHPRSIAYNNWSIHLGWEDGRKPRRTADLRYRNDDHTAWLIENSRKPGVFINFDIGGS